MSLWIKIFIAALGALLALALFHQVKSESLPFRIEDGTCGELGEEAARFLDEYNATERNGGVFEDKKTRKAALKHFNRLYLLVETATAEADLLIIPFGESEVLYVRFVQRKLTKDVFDDVYIIPEGLAFDAPGFSEAREYFSDTKKLCPNVLHRRWNMSR